jgi:hypothetical protein
VTTRVSPDPPARGSGLRSEWNRQAFEASFAVEAGVLGVAGAGVVLGAVAGAVAAAPPLARPGPPAPLQPLPPRPPPVSSCTAVTLKSVLSFTVARVPSAFVMWTSNESPSASVSARTIVAPGAAVSAAAVAFASSSPVSGVSVMPFA